MECATHALLETEIVLFTLLFFKVYQVGALQLKKLECANHACKCCRGALQKIVQEASSYKGSGGLTLKRRTRLVSAAQCSIGLRSKDPDRKKTVKLLERDLLNGPRHCFGIHDGCSSDFYSAAKQSDLPVVPSTSSGRDATVVGENEDMSDADEQDVQR